MNARIVGIAAIGLAFAGLGITAIYLSGENDAIGSPEESADSLYDIDYAKEYQAVQEAFDAGESSQAVASLQERYRLLGYDEEIIHILEHLVGEELFFREGKEGLSLCSTESPFLGCYHGFFAAAFPEGKQEELLQQAEEACRSLEGAFRQSSCIHGIGHGFAALEGQENLLGALSLCDKVSYSTALGNEMCYTGVFMEYNTASVHGPSIAALPREFDAQNPYAPCPELPAQYQSACYLQIVHWWGETDVLRNDFAALGELCRGIKGPAENKENCFRSAGMVAARFARLQPKEVIPSCMEMPEEGMAFCLKEAAKLLSIHGKGDALDVCGVPGSDFRQECAGDIEQFFCDTLLVCERT
ncbi:MAG: hypothetical protein Q8P12_06630 [bacterium]|nr:hypothetical protein [bacterium]